MESGFHKGVLVPADTQEGDNKQKYPRWEGKRISDLVSAHLTDRHLWKHLRVDRRISWKEQQLELIKGWIDLLFHISDSGTFL